MPRPFGSDNDRPPRVRRASELPSSAQSNDGICDCPMVAAVRSVKRGKLRLARRYAAMSARLIGRRMLRAS